MPVPVAFYAPLKSPDDPVPSGDREMARLYLAALAQGGFAPAVASRLRLFDRDGTAWPALSQAAAQETARLLSAGGPAPGLWFTYHVYYKAPDPIGPAVAAALGIPYVIAEGSRARRRAAGPWALPNAAAEAALDAADAILVMNAADRPALERARPPGQRLIDFPPFLDTAAWGRAARPPAGPELRLLAVAMMRPGDKLQSYRLLARALGQARLGDWRLDIVGDGPARPAVEALFAPFGPRVAWHGLVTERPRLAQLYAAADLLAWPAAGEAYGMVFLEAAAQGCPALAGAHGGVAGVVAHGRGGILVPPGDVDAFAGELERLASARDELRRLGDGAQGLVAAERSLCRAAGRLATILNEVMACGAAS